MRGSKPRLEDSKGGLLSVKVSLLLPLCRPAAALGGIRPMREAGRTMGPSARLLLNPASIIFCRRPVVTVSVRPVSERLSSAGFLSFSGCTVAAPVFALVLPVDCSWASTLFTAMCPGCV